ncbi:MAG: tetratricopeptide repeat protein [Bacteroidetes bacterium]|nr:tetratricopeptide repeat protein [Bacteroidota bacterium]
MHLLRNTILFLLLLSGAFVHSQPESNRLSSIIDSINANRFDSIYAWTLADSMLQLAKTEKESIHRANAYQSYGTLYYAYGNYDSSLKYWEAARDLYRAERDSLSWAKMERLIGVYYDIHSEISEALPHFVLSKDLYKATGNRVGLGEIYLSLGIIYQRLERFDLALENDMLALQIARDENNHRMIGPIYNNLGSLFQLMQKLDSAEKYLKYALDVQIKAGNEIGIARTYHNLGTLEYKRDNPKQALEYYILSIQKKSSMDESDIMSTYLQIGQCYTQLNQFDSARRILNEVLQSSEKNQNLQRQLEAYQYLSQLEERVGDYPKSLSYFKLFKELSDSALVLGYNNALKEQEAIIGLDQEKERNQELINAQRENEHLLRRTEWGIRMLIFLSFLLLLLIVFLVYNRRNLQRNRVILSKLNDELHEYSHHLQKNNERLESIMKEKNDLVSVLAHDLRSPFGKIQSIVQLFELTDDEAEKKSYLLMMDNITRDGIALINDLIDLSRLEQNQLVEEHQKRLNSFLLSDVFKRLETSFSSHLNAKNIKVQMNLSSEPLLNREDYCERICDNLLSNAIKYSFPDGVIRIDSKVEGEMMHIWIEDNGPGFKRSDYAGLFQRFSRLSAKPTGIESSTGLGLYIAKKLAESIGGDIVLESQEGQSAKFRISIPVNLKSQLEANASS